MDKPDFQGGSQITESLTLENKYDQLMSKSAGRHKQAEWKHRQCMTCEEWVFSVGPGVFMRPCLNWLVSP